MSKKKNICFFQRDYFNPILLPFSCEPIYEGELYGLSHEEAKNLFFIRMREGFFDDCD